MNLTLHHLRKDIRAQRWLIVLWLLATAALALPDLLIFQPDYDAARAVDSIRSSPLTMILGFIAWIVLVARLIQSEPVTGSTSFWLTRPVPKRVYLLGKFFFLAVIVMLPAFVPGIIHDFVLGSDSAYLESRIANMLGIQLIGALCVIWLATYTTSLVAFAGMLCLGAVVSVVANLLMSMYQHNFAARDSGYVVLVLAGLLVSLLVEHLRRGSRLGLYIGIVSIAFGFIYQFFAPPAPPSTPDPGIFRVPKITHVDFQPDWLSTLTWSSTNYGNGLTVPAAFARLTPIDANAANRVWINMVAAQFEVPGGFSGGLGNIGTAYFSVGPEMVENNDLIQAKMPGIKLATASNGVPMNATQNVGLFNLLGVEDKVRDQTGKLTLAVIGQVLEVNQVAAIPLGDPHYIVHLPGGFLRVRPVSQTQASHLLTVWSVGPTAFPSSSQGDYMCVLVDPQAATGKMLRNSGASSSSSGFRLGGMREVRDSVYDYVIDGTEPLDRMTLYVFQYEPAEQFNTTLVVPNFKMSPTTQ